MPALKSSKKTYSLAADKQTGELTPASEWFQEYLQHDMFVEAGVRKSDVVLGVLKASLAITPEHLEGLEQGEYSPKPVLSFSLGKGIAAKQHLSQFTKHVAHAKALGVPSYLLFEVALRQLKEAEGNIVVAGWGALFCASATGISKGWV